MCSICHLFVDASNTYCSFQRYGYEWTSGKVAEGGGHDLISGTMPALACRD